MVKSSDGRVYCHVCKTYGHEEVCGALTPPRASVSYRATCGVCRAVWAREEREPPKPCFCPDCQERKLTAPGVLTWTPSASGDREGLAREVALLIANNMDCRRGLTCAVTGDCACAKTADAILAAGYRRAP